MLYKEGDGLWIVTLSSYMQAIHIFMWVSNKNTPTLAYEKFYQINVSEVRCIMHGGEPINSLILWFDPLL